MNELLHPEFLIAIFTAIAAVLSSIERSKRVAKTVEELDSVVGKLDSRVLIIETNNGHDREDRERLWKELHAMRRAQHKTHNLIMGVAMKMGVQPRTEDEDEEG